jgi:sulfite reductase (NADPH) hemoprotein beta-component
MHENAEPELNDLAQLIDRLRRGDLTRSEFRSQSVHYGVYTQRESDRYFARIRVPCGIISAAQLNGLAGAIETHGAGECRLTTRQGIEAHELQLDQIMPLLRTLAELDLLSHETGGNSIRSVMVCPHAGVGTDEPFDVTPYAEALTRHFVRHPDFQSLPRKVKIAFSCCEQDCVRSFTQDLGFQARKNANSECGFRVLVGGGTGALPRLGQEIVDFLPAEQIFGLTEAFLRMFNRLGNRQNRRRARVKFLVESLGVPALSEEIAREKLALQRGPKSYPFAPAVPPARRLADEGERGSLERNPAALLGDSPLLGWVAAQTRPQRQRGFNTVRVSLAGGWIMADQLRQLAELLEGLKLEIRTTPEQGFLLRWARDDQLAQIYQTLAQVGLLKRLAVSRLIACPGSEACSNAFTNTPALARAITARLAALPAQPGALSRLRVRLSGCSNGCAHHATADIGLEGMASRAQDQWLPVYRLWLGARETQRHGRFGEDFGTVPARYVPACVGEIADLFLASRHLDESFADLLDRIGTAPFEAVVKRYQLRQDQDRQELAADWGETGRYRPRGLNEPGVC